MVLLKVVEEAQNVLNVGRTKPLELRANFHFIDEDRQAIESLRSILVEEGYGPRIGNDIFIKKSSFVSSYGEIKKSISERTQRSVGRSIFVLDQKGYTDAPLPIIRDILSSFSGAEVILTFAVDWLIDYLSDRPDRLRSISSLNLNEEQIRGYLSLKGDKGGRLVIQRLLLEHIRQETAALFVSPFFIRSRDANKDLWLVHLSNHVTARNVMVQTHWKTKNHSWHPGKGGFEILGFDPNLDPEQTPDFWFGTHEQDIMHERLSEDILKRLRDRHGSVPVEYIKFIASVANETPARLTDFDAVTGGLVGQKDLQILDTGGVVRRAKKPARTDFIGIPSQKSFYFPSLARKR